MALYDGLWNPHEPLVIRLVHRDGGVRALEQRTTGILDGERRVLAIEAISRDVTGRRGMEPELLAEVAVRRCSTTWTALDHDARRPPPCSVGPSMRSARSPVGPSATPC